MERGREEYLDRMKRIDRMNTKCGEIGFVFAFNLVISSKRISYISILKSKVSSHYANE